MSQLILPNEYDPYDNREYQQFGTKFLNTMRRAMLCDDPGLGKTIQAIRATELPAMVVAPRYLCEQWEEAIKREHGDAKIAFADGARYQREQTLSKLADWYIVNIEMLHSYELPEGIKTYINDESHHLRNRTATQSKAALLVENVDPTARIYNLTASPFWKGIDDIWMQAKILYPDVKAFSSYHDFVKTYCTSLRSVRGVSKPIRIKQAMRRGLGDLLKPIMLGRTYEMVGRFLPPIIETTVKIDLPLQQKQLYTNLVRDYSLKWESEDEQKHLIFNPTGLLHVLRQVTAQSGKFDAIEEILEDNQDVPFVIGLWYKDHAAMMHRKLGKSAVLITGDLDATVRHRTAMWAQANGKHIVTTQMSLMEGINLYKYRGFIFGEESHVPGANHQFLSRVVRDRNDNGRDRTPVRVFYVQAKGTVDVHIHRVSNTRKTQIEAVRELLELTLGKKAA